VGDTLQEGLQGGHAEHDHPLAEDAVLKEQEDHARANLATQTHRESSERRAALVVMEILKK